MSFSKILGIISFVVGSCLILAPKAGIKSFIGMFEFEKLVAAKTRAIGSQGSDPFYTQGFDSQTDPFSFDGSDQIRRYLEEIQTVSDSIEGSATFRVKKSYDFNLSQDSHESLWVEPHQFQLPQLIPVERGQSGNHSAVLEFKTSIQDRDSILCIYRGTGQKNRTSDGCNEPNGKQYKFNYCVSKHDFYANGCDQDLALCREFKSHQRLKAESKVVAQSFKFKINNGDRCEATVASIELKGLKPVKRDKLKCGAIVRAPFKLDHDLICDQYDGVALTIIGENADVDGQGFRISAPKSKVGLLVLGSALKVKGFVIENVSRGVGLLAYDVGDLNISNNKLTRNLINLEIGFEIENSGALVVEENNLSRGKLFGLRLYSSENVELEKPYFKKNDLRFTSGYAVKITANEFRLDSQRDFMVDGSHNAFFFERGEFLIENVDFSNKFIKNNVFFLSQARDATVRKVNVSNNAPLSTGIEHVFSKLSVSEFEANNISRAVKSVRSFSESEVGLSSQSPINDSQSL